MRLEASRPLPVAGRCRSS